MRHSIIVREGGGSIVVGSMLDVDLSVNIALLFSIPLPIDFSKHNHARIVSFVVYGNISYTGSHCPGIFGFHCATPLRSFYSLFSSRLEHSVLEEAPTAR